MLRLRLLSPHERQVSIQLRVRRHRVVDVINSRGPCATLQDRSISRDIGDIGVWLWYCYLG